MAQTFTIDSIEGNSYIGVPVFSRFGQMQNYNYIVMSPQKKLKEPQPPEEPIIDQENLKYKLLPVEVPAAGDEGKSKSAGQALRTLKEGSAPPNAITPAVPKGDPNQTVGLERRQFITSIMVSDKII